jgi:hypothetical protein
MTSAASPSKATTKSGNPTNYLDLTILGERSQKDKMNPPTDFGTGSKASLIPE